MLCLVINSLQDSLVAINRKNDILCDNLSDPQDKSCTPDLGLQGYRMICVGRHLWMSLLLQVGHLLCPLCSWRPPRTEVVCGFIFCMTWRFQQAAEWVEAGQKLFYLIILFIRAMCIGRRGSLLDWYMYIYSQQTPSEFLIIISDIRSLDYNAKVKNVVG